MFSQFIRALKLHSAIRMAEKAPTRGRRVIRAECEGASLAWTINERPASLEAIARLDSIEPRLVRLTQRLVKALRHAEAAARRRMGMRRALEYRLRALTEIEGSLRPK